MYLCVYVYVCRYVIYVCVYVLLMHTCLLTIATTIHSAYCVCCTKNSKM